MKIITLGTATLDIIFQTTERIITGEKIDISNSFFSLGGGALNAATTFKNLNLNYLVYFRLGKDLIGKVILDQVRQKKFKTEIFFHRGESQFSVVILPQEGSKDKNKFSERTIFVYRGLSDHFTWQELNRVKESFFYYLTTANTDVKVFNKFLLKIRNFAQLISINPSKNFLADHFSANALKTVDLIFLNREELSTFLHYKDQDLILAKEFVKKINPKIFVLTRGDKGSITFWQNKIFIADIFKPQKNVDTTGAGDAFASAFFANLVISRDFNEKVIKRSIIWGSANASANIEKLGAQIGLLKKNQYSSYSNLKIRTLLWIR